MQNGNDKTMEFIASLPEVNSVCTYGSGFFTQDESSENKDMDLMISVDNPNSWHLQNYFNNPQMYDNSGLQDLLRHSNDASFPGGLGAFFTNYKGTGYKLVVVDKRLLYNDLKTWQHFSLPGRFQKPMKLLVDNSNGVLPKLMKENYENAIKVVLLTRSRLPFSKRTLYKDITSLSYKGDIRVLAHFENPDKVKNIVSGAYNFFEYVYGNSDLYDYLGDYIMRKDSVDNTEIIDTLPSALKNHLLEDASYRLLRNDAFTSFKINNYIKCSNLRDSALMALRCRETVGMEKTLYTLNDKLSKGLMKGK